MIQIQKVMYIPSGMALEQYTSSIIRTSNMLPIITLFAIILIFDPLKTLLNILKWPKKTLIIIQAMPKTNVILEKP